MGFIKIKIKNKMKFATIAACVVATVSAQRMDTRGRPGESNNGTQSLTINAERMGGEMSVNASNDFYSGKVTAMRDEYTWEYKRSGAAALLGSTLAFANAALYMA